MKKIVLLMTIALFAISLQAKPKVNKERDRIRLSGYLNVIEEEVYDHGVLVLVKLKCKDPGDDKCRRSTSIYSGYTLNESMYIDLMFDEVDLEISNGNSNGNRSHTYNFLNTDTGLMESWLYNIIWVTNPDGKITEEFSSTLIN